MACVIEVAANGEALDSADLATVLLIYGRITSGNCTRVRCRVRLFAGAPVMFSGEADTDSNGTWSCHFPLTVAPLACGTPLWVEAQCISGDNCSVAQTVYMQCKLRPGGGGGNPPGGGNNGGGNGNDDDDGWQWPWPPEIFCPTIGRLFTQTLLISVIALLGGVALLNNAVILGALAAIGACFAVFFGIWTWFCQPHICYVIGAILWVAKRGTIAALVLLVISPNVAMFMAIWGMGTIAGVLTGWLRRRRCPIPSLRTPINQLPVW